MDIPLLSFSVFFYLLSVTAASTTSYYINCGATSSTTEQGQVFTGDSSPPSGVKLLFQGSTTSSSNSNNSISSTARAFTSNSSYQFTTSPGAGTYLLRLHLFAFSNTLASAHFIVSSNGHTLLPNFTGSEALNSPVLKEFLVPVEPGEDTLRLYFIPIGPSGSAFVNAIELIFAPLNLTDLDSPILVTPSSGYNGSFGHLGSRVLSPLYRLNVGGSNVTASVDTLRRNWWQDDSYLVAGKDFATRIGPSSMVNWQNGNSSLTDAPEQVYNTARGWNASSDSTANVTRNATWSFSASNDTSYFVRLHFCDIVSIALGEISFNLYLFNKFAWDDKSRISFVYGSNDRTERSALWNDLGSFNSASSPWSVLGDFNCLLDISDKINFGTRTYIGIQELQQVFITNQLVDHDSSGAHFTWSNQQMGDRRVACKLDRIAINSCWHNFFPDSTALFDSPGFSDHSPGILKLTSTSLGRIFPFKFKNFWTEEADFADVVHNCWSFSVAGNPQFRLATKLKRLKGTLKSWQKGRFRDFEVMIAECSSALDQAHTHLHSDLSSVTLQTNVQNAKALLDLRLNQYESFVQQRSKIQWIKYGEETSALFHRCIKSRAAGNSIVSLTSDQGLQLTEQDDIASEVIGFFTGLFGSSPSSVVSQFQIQGPIVDYSSHPSLCAIPSEDEIQTAFFGISKIKSPGPDGFGSWFFKNQWAIVKSDACSALQDFFRRGRLLKQVNATFICLIAKVDDPFKISQFRPISLCNTTLKAISKVIVNRIRPLLDEIVAYTQGAFIPGRSIASNLCVAQDLVKGYGSRSISPRCMLQIDLQKAYDYVSWEFLERCLTYFNFPAQLVGWIMATVTTTSYSVILNGESKGFFQGRRGLRQGDPLSPYLFVLIMEVLHRRLWEVSHSPGFSFHPRCKTLGISSIAFADDLLIFCKPNATTLRMIKSCLEEFAVDSGLSTNPAKSKVFFAGVFGSQKDTLADILGFAHGSWPVRYLGIPLNCKRLRIRDFKPLLDRLNSALSSRNARLLSYAGRMIVIKSVLESISSFWMQTLLLPKGVISLIKKLCRSFLWSGSVDSKRSLVAWKVVTRRWNEGGLNFKELLSWNKTLLMKLLFHLHVGKSSLWTLWAKRNLMTCDSIWACYPRAGCSILWRKLLTTRDELSSLPGFDLTALALSNNPSKMDNQYVYEVFHSRSPDLSWCSVIWNKTVPRKWAFICWLAMIDRLPTAAKLQAWGCIESSTCCLCQQGPEDSTHLWFQCTVTSSILDRILGWQGVSLRLNSLQDWWHWFSSCSHSSSDIYKRKLLAFSAVIYHCWLFRNEVVFRNATIDIETLVLKIIVDCKFRCLHKLNITR